MISGFICRNLVKRYRPVKVFLILPAVILISFALASPALAEEISKDKNDWEYFWQLNLWAPDITFDTTGKKIKIGIDDIVDNLDFVYTGTFGVKKNRWTFLTDVNYLDLEFDHGTNLVDNPLIKLDLDNVQLTGWSLTPMVAYNIVNTDKLSLDVLAGVRYLHIKAETETTQRILLTTTQSSNSKSGDAWNGIVGIRGDIYLPGKWYIPYYFDVGAGDTELTWQAYAAIAYRFEHVGLSVGYRHLEWKLDEDDAGGELIEDLSASGPMIGIKYWF